MAEIRPPWRCCHRRNIPLQWHQLLPSVEARGVSYHVCYRLTQWRDSGNKADQGYLPIRFGFRKDGPQLRLYCW